MSDVVAMEREAEGSDAAPSALAVAAGSPEDFAAVMKSVQEASRAWNVRDDLGEGKFVSAMLGLLGWLGRVNQAAQAELRQIAQKQSDAAKIELARAEALRNSSSVRETAMSTSSNLLADLTVDQATAASLTGAVLVLAGAGTGKTKTLTAGVAHRIAARGIPASRILAVTFTNKAAGEMLSRIRVSLGEGSAPGWVGTFHGLGARQLRVEPEVADLRPGFDIIDADDSRRMIKRVIKGMNLSGADDDVSIGRDPLKVMCNRISAFKDALVIPGEAAAHVEAQIAKANGADLRIDPHHLRMAARVYVEYQRVLRDANAADFGDLLLWPVRAMQANRDYLNRWAGRFDAVLADEYQDVNQAQYSWLRMLAAAHGELFAVGDDDQAVYSWRGADIRYIRRFNKDFPNATQVRLEENFRSTGHILAGANAVIAQDRGRLGKTLYTRKPSGDPIEVVGFRNAEAEALGIAVEIQRRHAEGSSWQDIAILYRSNALSRGFEEALMRSRIPYVLIGDVGFYQRAEVKDTLALLRLAAFAQPSAPDALAMKSGRQGGRGAASALPWSSGQTSNSGLPPIIRDQDGREIRQIDDNPNQRVAEPCLAGRDNIASNEHVGIGDNFQRRHPVTVILPDGILEVRPCGALRKMLRPLLAVRTTHNEAGIGLRLKHKDRVWTQDQVVELRQPTAVRQDDIVQRGSAQERELTGNLRLALLSGDPGLDLLERVPLLVGDEVRSTALAGKRSGGDGSRFFTFSRAKT